jgi:hypothetical protein
MCLVLYIGSDVDCPLLEPQDLSVIDRDDPFWSAKVVPFSVQELAGDEKSAAKHFNTKIVWYAGSFEGCGCGFNASYAPEWGEPAAEDNPFLAGTESRRLLREYVEQHQIRQIYACWSGDEAIETEARLDITPDKITDPCFQFPERTLLRIKKADKSEQSDAAEGA